MSKKHLVRFVEDSSFGTRIFKKKKHVKAFVEEFHKMFSDESSNWIDLIVYDIKGEILNDEQVQSTRPSKEKL